MRLKTIVIDDEPLASDLIERYIERTPFLEHIATFATAVEAINSDLLAQAELLFLDIQMPNLSGLEFSRMVYSGTKIIFTTAFNQYAIDGYRVNALDYLLKPISYADFLTAATKAFDWYKMKVQADESKNIPKESDFIYIKSDYKLIRIDLSDILYIEGMKDYVKFHTKNSDKPILTLMNIKSAEDMLPMEQFIRVHRSFIVRRDQIKIIERSQIIFGKERIPIGGIYKTLVQDYLGIYREP